jgi:hypothetical protein
VKRQRLDIKKTIKKQIELKNKQLVFLNKKTDVNKKPNMNNIRNERFNQRITPAKPIVNNKEINLIQLEPYQKKFFVDYDVVICIPSYERYEKVKRLIKQFYEQPTKYTFKIILLNDGSIDIQYNTLSKEFPDIIYLKNEMPNGKILHWYCYNQLWEFLKMVECHAVLQMDDDFILCNYFLDIILDLYFQKKEEDYKILAIAPHTWAFNKINNNIKLNKYTIDGIGLFDSEFIKAINYELKPVSSSVTNKGVSAGAWTQIINILKKNNYYVYRTENSLVWHDGYNDSKLHTNLKDTRKIYTQDFIDKNRNYD